MTRLAFPELLYTEIRTFDWASKYYFDHTDYEDFLIAINRLLSEKGASYGGGGGGREDIGSDIAPEGEDTAAI